MCCCSFPWKACILGQLLIPLLCCLLPHIFCTSSATDQIPIGLNSRHPKHRLRAPLFESHISSLSSTCTSKLIVSVCPNCFCGQGSCNICKSPHISYYFLLFSSVQRCQCTPCHECMYSASDNSSLVYMSPNFEKGLTY